MKPASATLSHNTHLTLSPAITVEKMIEFLGPPQNDDNDEPENKPPQIIIYETDDKVARVSVRLEDESVWLTQQQLSDLYGTSRPNVTMHIKNIFSDGEVDENSVCKKFLQTAADGKNYEVLFYNLDMIISPRVSNCLLMPVKSAMTKLLKRRASSMSNIRRGH